ncbi:2-oxo-4-hydroxy-4-carboxy-5-ureidoimidazoline decarboxylase [Leptolyngbya sp. NK1-12]|uniref:2-oxo-4-hydroxy-4-carboxy-5-ureidoimidazoline decarboxylase n=1 Tax=Leptolyngbya sp. NK1-12 TaxID=2547451 RepID=A0AA97AIU9_9CYAN|nr:2-oxo-4-hydroxy-4-carboxy-5-ureidoimidazoline decarboxylase [Leptolyngbya sp. NK1-12]WNZ25934.1 2-oxo-4-hydroxy-4-carboxy-5-ureidoimidazoline decarboxylase [Leptolyngbya sp. NK1-12]
MFYSITELNQSNQDAFVAALGSVFENTPSIAAQAWEQRPFADVNDLHQKMVAVVQKLSTADQLALICAHPDLGSRVKMAEASVKEQAGVGLDRLSPDEYERFQQLNHSYREKFGFPFIIAVKNHTRESILAAFEQRLLNAQSVELQQALAEIAAISRFRLLDLIG